MADVVTKKDLQQLQGTVDKQIKEIEKRLVKAEGNISILTDIPTKQDDAMAKLFMEITDNLKNRINALERDVAKLK